MKTQIWIAVSIYVLVAIVRKRLGLEASLYQILQILSVTLFEKLGYLVDSSWYNMLWLGGCRTPPESVSSWKLGSRQRRRAASVLLQLRWAASCGRRSAARPGPLQGDGRGLLGRPPAPTRCSGYWSQLNTPSAQIAIRSISSSVTPGGQHR